MPLPPVFDRSTQAPRRPSVATPPIAPQQQRGFFQPGTSRILRAVGAGLNPQLLPLQQQVLQKEEERIRRQQEQEQKGRDRNLKFLMDARGKVQDPNVLREIDAKIQELGGPDVSMIPPVGPEVPFGRTAEGGVLPEFLTAEQQLAEAKRAPAKPGALITLQVPGEDRPRTFRQNDPQVDQLISEGATKVRVSGTPEQTGILTGPQRGKIEAGQIELETSVRQNVQNIEPIIDMIASPEFIGGTAGQAVSAINSAAAQFRQLTGTDSIMKDGLLDEKQLDLSDENLSRFRKAAITGDRAESAVVELAFIHAKSLNPDGKISDADVSAAQRILGKGADKITRINLLKDVQKRLIRNFNIGQKVLAKRDKREFTPMKMEDIFEPEQPPTPSGIKFLGFEE